MVQDTKPGDFHNNPRAADATFPLILAFIILFYCLTVLYSLVQGRRVDVAKVCVLYKLLVIDAGKLSKGCNCMIGYEQAFKYVVLFIVLCYDT